MIYRVKRFAWNLNRFFSRSEWMVKLLRLSASKSSVATPGLVMIQIDGLGNSVFERALRERKMPFLRALVEKENYSKHIHYSGLPSNTPSVQGMLFYGVKSCVPAFCFFDRQAGRIVNLFEPESADLVEERLQKKGIPLLTNGSSYGNIFSGGAKESHFCVTTMGWTDILKAANPFTLTVTLLLNFHILIRAFFLGVIEIFLAVLDCIRSILLGKDLQSELLFIPMRVSICVLLREMVTVASKIDIARGVPIIHLNLAGYDEQAHHRGPHSRYATWTLRGIDNAIARVWKAAKQSSSRDYEVWIYSDHGQEATDAYRVMKKGTIQEAVTAVFEERILKDKWEMSYSTGLPHWRANLLQRRRPASPVSPVALKGEQAKESRPHVFVAAMGSIGHIYSPLQLEPKEKEKFASSLVFMAKIPLVMAVTDVGEVQAWTAEGKFALPQDASEIFGSQHPFLKEISRDLVELCRHPDAGTFIISGWKKGKKSISFPIEQGAHAGPGPSETTGFALFPPGFPIDAHQKAYLETEDLRLASAHFLGRTDIYSPQEVIQTPIRSTNKSSSNEPLQTVRLMTYNVHSCIGMDGKISPARIAKVIARHRPDIVALQELDISRKRTRGEHQAEIIAQELKMTFEFQAALSIKTEHYGDAILSRFPMRSIHVGSLPSFSARKYYEPRGALWVQIDVNGKKIHVINTHLSIWQKEGLLQAQALLGPDWIRNPACQGPVVLCGDFNALPRSPVFDKISRVLRDAQLGEEGEIPSKHHWTFYPIGRIDHVFVGPNIRVLTVQVPKTHLETVSSDHLPLIVELQI